MLLITGIAVVTESFYWLSSLLKESLADSNPWFLSYFLKVLVWENFGEDKNERCSRLIALGVADSIFFSLFDSLNYSMFVLIWISRFAFDSDYTSFFELINGAFQRRCYRCVTFFSIGFFWLIEYSNDGIEDDFGLIGWMRFESFRAELSKFLCGEGDFVAAPPI